MSIPFDDRLHNVANYGDPSISDQLKFSCFSFFDYALLNAGAFTNISFPTGAYPSGIGSHSSAPYFLRSSRDPRYASGQVWEGFKNNWVWETGISRAEQPIMVSGVYINDTFYSTGTVGATGFKIIHPEGRIIFNSPIPTTSQVKCQFSYKNVKIAMADAPWFQSIQFDSLRPDSQQFKQSSGSGSWDVLSTNRIQLPAIVIDSVPRVLLSAFEMGSLRRYHRQELAFHIFTETAFERDQLHDIIIDQWDRTVVGISKKNMMASGVMPLSYDGTINPSGLNYRQAIDSVSYRWNQFRFEQVRSAEVESRTPMYRAIVKALLAIDGY